MCKLYYDQNERLFDEPELYRISMTHVSRVSYISDYTVIQILTHLN